ncbi:MAG: NPCBM/NEW2 domain-containing protein [Planctomycetaceae bacterium]
MKYASYCLPMILLISSIAAGSDIVSERKQVAEALKILDAWHAERPQPGERYLHLVCWTPLDRDFPADYQARLTRIMEHIQAFYADQMEHYGMPNRTIRLKYDGQQVLLHKVRGEHPAAHYARESGSEIRTECLPVVKQAGIDADNETIFLVCNLADWDAEKLRFTHKSPYYAGGSFRNGTAWQLDSPELDPRNLELQEPMIDDGEYGHISLGKHNSIFIGGMAHELGHALGLPHCSARPDESVKGEALMGSGNRTYGDELRGEAKGSFLTLAHALRLASHPQFSGSVKGLNQEAQAEMNDVQIESTGKALYVSGVVKGDPPVYAVVAYFDPEGGSDYDATTATAVPFADGRFSLSSDALHAGKQGELRLFPLHANGSAAGQMSSTKFRYSYNIAADGTPDLTAIQTRQQLQPILEALASGDLEKAKTLAADIRLKKAAAIAARLIQPFVATQSPADYHGAEDSVALTVFKPSSAKVGWGQPVFDRVPDEGMLLESAGQFFETGIYAHAPAHHVYQLNGKWLSFSGHAGLAAGHDGSVEFEIKGDGRTLWKSDVIRSSATVDFDVKLGGVQQLELLTATTPDGASADWGFWLEPTLKRMGGR